VIPGVPDFGFGPVPVPGRADALAPGLVRLTAPNPGLMTGPGTNTYLIGEAEVAVIDPGPDDEAHRAAILAAAADRGPIRCILVTHTHLDHAPGAAALAAATGATVVGHRPADGFAPDECVGEGWELGLAGGISLRALHTPGHASDHLCWLLPASHTLLTGDHMMHGSTVVIRPPDGDLLTYLASLQRVNAERPAITTLAPGHGRLMDHVPEMVDALVAHRLGRHATIAAALDHVGEGSVDDLLPVVYADVSEAQKPVARFSLWAHLRALAQEGSATALEVERGGDTIDTRWRAGAVVQPA
jgi:glyoxylase-like metal-dependent hydrolase (beta-lactamase superfamily II)